MKKLFGIFLFTSLHFHCLSQDTMQKTIKPFDFFDITFYSSECNGVCPDITMSINSYKKIQLIRHVFKSKGVVDKSQSGGFKGELSQQDFDTLIFLIKEIDWDHIVWPKMMCCDLPVKTIMLGINGESKKFKSMKWPQEANKLIEFLTKLGSSVKLPSYAGAMDFEVIDD